MKKIVSIVLGAALVLGSLSAPALAADTEAVSQQQAAEVLQSYGVMSGSGNGFQLDGALTRPAAITLIVKLTGHEDDALKCDYSHPFTDVPAWADRYVAYAYSNGITSGVSETSFGTGNISAPAFITMVLRAAGYSDAEGDFSWSAPYGLAGELGLLDGTDINGALTRGNAAILLYNSLFCDIKGTDTTLGDVLRDKAESDALLIKNSPNGYTASDIYTLGKNAVFELNMFNSEGTLTARGSGFFISSDGTAITCAHCVEGFYSAKAVMADGTEYDVEGIYAIDTDNDWAVVKVDGKGFNYFSVADKLPAPGETVYTLGSPLGFDYSVSQGVVAAGERTDEDTGFVWLQATAQISSGSSGGALINTSGQVVGISEGAYTSGQNINIFVPAYLAMNYSRDKLTTLAEYNGFIVKDISSYRDYPTVPDFGSVFGVKCLGTEKNEEADTITYYYNKALANAAAGGSAFSEYVRLITDRQFFSYYYASENDGIFAKFVRSEDDRGYLVTINSEVQYKDTACFAVTVNSWDISPLKYYEGSKNVPDFGDYFGVETTSVGKTDGRVYYYEYLVGSFAYHANDKRYINIYANLLFEEDFELASSYTVSASTFYRFTRNDGTRVDLEVYGFDTGGFFSITIYNGK